MSYPLVVELRATYETVRWYDECDLCGMEVTANTDGRAVVEEFGRYGEFHGGGGLVCPEHGLRSSAEVSPTENPDVESGWCNVLNPYGDRGENTDGYPEVVAAWVEERDEYTLLASPLEAAEIVAEFPGAVWDLHEGSDGDTDYRTGAVTRVTLHVDDDHAALVSELVALLHGVAA